MRAKPATLVAALVALLCAGALPACGGGSSPPSQAAPAPPAPPSPGPAPSPSPAPGPDPAPAPPLRVRDSIIVDGRDRSFTLVLPADHATVAQAVPLIVALHGGGGSSTQFEASTGLTAIATAAGYAVVYPDGVEAAGPMALRTWNAGRCCGFAATNGIDDVGFIGRLLATLTERYRIDPARIHAAGHSNGAMLTYRLGCELSDRIASIAANAGPLMVDTCSPVRPVPVLHLHSKRDTNVPWPGGAGSGIAGVTFPSMPSVIARWVAIDGCSASAITTVASGHYEHSTWAGCLGGSSVEYWLTDDGGHAWPGGQPGSAGADVPSTVINANDLILSFFGQHRLR